MNQIAAEPDRTIPGLEDLHAWTSRPDDRVVVRDVDWAFYEQLVDSTPGRAGIQIDFDGKDLEIMSPSLMHDDAKGLLGQLIEAVAQVLEIPYKAAGQTTWKRRELARGLEADECYFFHADKLDAVARSKALRSMDVADYPNPDLAIEVDLSHTKIDRAGIYSAMKVAEVWRFDGDLSQVIIERLESDGSYHPAARSQFLPIRPDEVRRWLIDEDSRDESAWARRLRGWVQAELSRREKSDG